VTEGKVTVEPHLQSDPGTCRTPQTSMDPLRPFDRTHHPHSAIPHLPTWLRVPHINGFRAPLAPPLHEMSGPCCLQTRLRLPT
jgi:hypothetical protein